MSNNNNRINSKISPSVRLQGPDQTLVAVLAVLAVLVVSVMLVLAVVVSTRQERRLPWSFLLP